MARHEPRSCFLTGDDVNNVLAVEPATVAQKLLLAIIVIVLTVNKPGLKVPEGVQRQRLFERPASERPRRVLDVILRVVPYSHGEQLQDLAAVVLVDGIAMVLVVVEPIDHGRVSR